MIDKRYHTRQVIFPQCCAYTASLHWMLRFEKIVIISHPPPDHEDSGNFYIISLVTGFLLEIRWIIIASCMATNGVEIKLN